MEGTVSGQVSSWKVSDYFENSIAIADKNKLKGLIPRNLFSLKDVYEKLGNNNDYQSTMYKLIDAAYRENDTLYILRAATTCLEPHLTEKDRNFKKADSLLKRMSRSGINKKGYIFHHSLFGKYWLELLSGKKL